MNRFHALLLSLTLIFCAAAAYSAEPKILIAFSSYRERLKQPQIYLYEHDGVDQGKMVENIPTLPNRSDNRVSLSSDGRYCAFAAEMENETSRIALWDRAEKK